MKFLFRLFFSAVVFIGLAAFVGYRAEEAGAPTQEQNINTTTPAITPIIVTLSGETVQQGETLVIETSPNVEQLFLGKTSIPFSTVGDKKIALVGFDTRETPAEETLSYLAYGTTTAVSFRLTAKQYPVTKIVIPKELADQGVTSGDLIASITQTDSVTLTDILSTFTDTYYFTEPFVYPLKEWSDVGGFGNVREDKNGAIRHLGVDLAGKVGDPVYAVNRGRIAYAGELQNYGNSVVIDHGLGIYSIYLHLSEIRAKGGDLAGRGEVIGLVGNTGDYTLEPHLHFSLKIRDASVNPKQFIDTLNSTLGASL